MIQRMYAIRDIKGERYNPPFAQNTHAEAERNFMKLVQDPKTDVNQFPQDFDLWYLGTYNSNTGIIDAKTAPEKIADATQFVSKQ